MKSIVRTSDGKKVWHGEDPANKPNLVPPNYAVLDGLPPPNIKFPKWDFVNTTWVNDAVAEADDTADKQNIAQGQSQAKQAFKDFRQLVNSNPTWDQANIQSAMDLLKKLTRYNFLRD